MDELKPCPFCELEDLELNSYHEEGTKWFYYACKQCGATGGDGMTQSLAAYSWNKRPIEDALRAEITELREAQG